MTLILQLRNTFIPHSAQKRLAWSIVNIYREICKGSSYRVACLRYFRSIRKQTIETSTETTLQRGLTSKDIDKVKLVFAEGYLAGKINNAQSTKLRTILMALICGVIIGFFFPTILLLVSISKKSHSSENFDGTSFGVRTKFSDVKGALEAKKELQDLVKYLKNPEKVFAVGGKLPRGVLLVGPPGNGKTLLARACAGEAEVPFFQISGSEFEEMFVGEGARRVRELFKKAKMNAPCIVFIDEVDSVASRRTNSPMHPHSNQTINQLLTEMDGFKKTEGVIIIAATNRREDLDPAFLRPGRFDVEVLVPPPTYKERKDIIEYYLQTVVHKDVDSEVLARGTVGFTAADLANMVNRAALKAALANEKFVNMKYLIEERDRYIMGPESKIAHNDSHSNKITAYHEGGHCVVAYFTEFSPSLHKVTIVPRGTALGHTAYLPDKDEVYITKAQILARIDCLLGGRVAEELVFGGDQVTSGAADDLQKASELATNMVTKWGMSEKIGLGTYNRDTSAGPSPIIEEEVHRILQESYERTKDLLSKYSKEHAMIADALLVYETLEAHDIKEILSKQYLND